MGRESKCVVLCCMALFSFWAYAKSDLLAPNGDSLEVEALIDIKKALDDPEGLLITWDPIALDPCRWNMVSCSADGLVSALAFPGQGLSGKISPSIGNLTHLERVFMQKNKISGKIPSEFGRLHKLQTIDLSNNLLTGEIPSSLSELDNLQYLRLNNNNLSGTIPSSLANMTQLTFLDLSFNNLSAPVPRIMANIFCILGNPMICATGKELNCYGTSPSSSRNPLHPGRPRGDEVASAYGSSLAFGSSVAFICLLILELL